MAKTTRARREEREALEKLAKARRVRRTNAFARFVRSARFVQSVISSEGFAAQQAANALTLQPAQSAPPAPLTLPIPPFTPAPPVPRPLSICPSFEPISLAVEKFATHVPRKNGSLPPEKIAAESNQAFDRSEEVQSFFMSVNGSFIRFARAVKARERDPASEIQNVVSKRHK